VAWKKVDLRPGERREVECQIDPLFTACFDSSGERWKHEPGTYTVYAGGSSRDLPLQAEFSMKGDAAK
jgi:beta-glucosidase